jgi:hypothetical protein
MYTWLITPNWNKRVIKLETYTKDLSSFTYEVGFLSGKFKLYTETDIMPDISKGVDILNCNYKTEIIEINDECWDKLYYNCDETTRYWIEDFLDDENLKKIGYYGWQLSNKQIIIKCDFTIERINI